LIFVSLRFKLELKEIWRKGRGT